MSDEMFKKLKNQILARLPARTRAIYQYCLGSDPSCITVSIAWEEGNFGVSRATVKKHLDELVKTELLVKNYEDKDTEEWIDTFLQAGETGCRTVYAVKGYSIRHSSERKVGRRDLDDIIHSEIPRNVRIAIKYKSGKCDSCSKTTDSPCIRPRRPVKHVVSKDATGRQGGSYEVFCVACANRAGWDLTVTCVLVPTFKSPLANK